MRYEALKVDEVFNIGNEEAVFNSHVLNILLQAVTHVRAKQTLLNAKRITRPHLIIGVNFRFHLWQHIRSHLAATYCAKMPTANHLFRTTTVLGLSLVTRLNNIVDYMLHCCFSAKMKVSVRTKMNMLLALKALHYGKPEPLKQQAQLLLRKQLHAFGCSLISISITKSSVNKTCLHF